MCSCDRVRLSWLIAAWCLPLFAAAPGRAAEPADFVWIEGEKPASATIKANLAGWGQKHFLSEEKWLHVSLDPAKVDKELPAEGALLAYAFTIPRDGTYEVWNRIGFEFVRSPFDWRIGRGAWARVGPQELTTDCMELDFWCEVAWLKLGSAALAAGEHRLEIRLPKTKDKKGKTARILYASDAICLSRGAFSAM